ncbi:hypothetical protein BD413DRAFT_573910 [Trametes elegans]|nr:hypothetical protein BD413DRAFT_573910 [Trametes elegans]
MSCLYCVMRKLTLIWLYTTHNSGLHIARFIQSECSGILLRARLPSLIFRCILGLSTIDASRTSPAPPPSLCIIGSTPMSLSGGLSASEILDLYQTNYVGVSVQFAGQAFLIYDWILTISEEVGLFCIRRLTGASVLYLFIRYIGLLAYGILPFATFGSISDASCALIIKTQAFFAIFAYIPWAVFSALRVLALSRMNKPLAGFVLVLSLASPIVNFMNFGYGLTGVNVLTTGCQGEDATPLRVTLIFTIISRTTFIIADLVVILVTIRSTRRKGLVVTSLIYGPTSLGEVLFYDGSIYFIVITCLNAVDLVLTLLSDITPNYHTAYVSILSDPLTTVLLSHFLLDLQAADRASVGLRSSCLDGGTGITGTTLRFASLAIGSMGASHVPTSRGMATRIDCDVQEDLAGQRTDGVTSGDSI